MTAEAPLSTGYPAGGLSCPVCGRWLYAEQTAEQVECRCGLVTSGDLVREAAYLQAGIPKWNRRLVEVHGLIAGAEAAPSDAGATPQRTPAGPPSQLGAHTVLLGLGAILVIAGVVALAAFLWESLGPGGQVGLLGGLVVVSGAVAVYVARRMPATGMALSLVALGCWFTFTILGAYTVDAAFASLGKPEFTVMFAATAVVGLLAGRLWRMPAWSVVGAVAIPLALASAMALVAAHSDEAAASALSAAALGLLGILGITLPQASVVPYRVAVVAVTLALAPVFLVASLILSAEPANVILVAGVLVGLGLVCVVSPKTSRAGPVLLGLAAGASLGFGLASPWPSLIVVLGCVAIGMLLPAWHRFIDPITGLVASAVWLVFAWTAYEPRLWEFDQTVTDLTVGWAYVALLAGLGVIGGIRAIRVRSVLELLAFCVPAVLSVILAVALLSTMVDRDGTLEWFTVPIALVLACYAFGAWRLRPDLPSIVTVGPSVAVLLIPAAILGIAEDGVTRVYVVMAISVVAVVAGFLLRLVGLVVPSAVALVIVALEPLGLLASSLPSWVSYSAAGLILLVVGARFEHVRTRARRAGRWFGENMR
jgi:hypothetical protein